MKSCKTLENLIKRTTIDYHILMARAEKGMKVKNLGEGVYDIVDSHNRTMRLYFEDEKLSSLIKTEYNYR